MPEMTTFFLAHPFWIWLAIAAIFLIVELSTGSGWLLWPAGSAALIAIVTIFAPIAWPWQLILFAAATVISTYIGRRLMPRTTPPSGMDINDPLSRLVGRHGAAAAPFKDGAGRVFVDGKEWSAELDGGGEVEKGQKLEVTAIVGGARLKVKPA
jgi:membrane protein implicated in regulation of membrane protease activity